MHRFFLLLLLSLGALFPVWAAESTPPFVALAVPKAKLVGEGRMRFMFWDVYDAKLYAPNGQLNASTPFALSLHYLRELEGEAIAKRSVEEMRKQGFNDEVKLAAWFGEMRKIFPNVEDGDSLTGIFKPEGETVFYRGETEIGTVHDPQFGPHFFDIWLSPKTTAPKLRASLVGKHGS